MKAVSVVALLALPLAPVGAALAQTSSSPAGSPPQQTQPGQPSMQTSPSQPSYQSQPSQQPSSSQPSMSQQGSTSGQQSAVKVDSESLIGSTVRSREGKDVGKVTNLQIDPSDGRVSGVVVSMGGVAGIGGREIIVPWDAVQLGRDQQNLVLTLEENVLQQAPARAEEKKKQDSGGQASPSGQNQKQNQQKQDQQKR